MSDQTPMTCTEFVELVTEYLEGALDDATARRFDEHLALCPGCVTYLDQIRETIGRVGELREEHLAPDARAHLLDAFRDWSQR